MKTLLLVVLFCFFTPAAVQAACATSTTVTATAMAFGTINPFVLPQNTTATLSLKYSRTGAACNESAVITLGLGTGTGATAAIRKMTSGANTVNYTIYTPPGPPTLTVWDNVTGYAAPSFAVPANGTSTQTITMYGQILTGQSNAPTGSYSDTVVITCTF